MLNDSPKDLIRANKKRIERLEREIITLRTVLSEVCNRPDLAPSVCRITLDMRFAQGERETSWAYMQALRDSWETHKGGIAVGDSFDVLGARFQVEALWVGFERTQVEATSGTLPSDLNSISIEGIPMKGDCTIL